MLSRYFLLLLTLSIAGVPLWTSAQQTTGQAEDAAVAYLERNWNRHDLASQADVQDLVITDAVTSRRSGRISVYLHQGIGSIPVIDGQMTISVDENGHVFHAAGQLIPGLSSRAVHSGAGVSPAAAAGAVASEAGFPVPEPFQIIEQGVGPTQKTTLTDAGGFTYLPVTAELVYIVDDAGDLRLVWDATVALHGDDGAWRGLVDASSGEVLRLKDVLVRDKFSASERSLRASSVSNHRSAERAGVVEELLIVKDERSTFGMLPLISSASTLRSGGPTYRVFAWPWKDPFHADPAWPDDGRTVVAGIEDPTASPCGWHDIDDPCAGVDYTITRGNNVHAFPDHNNSDAPNPAEPDGGAALNFDFPIDFAMEPETYIDAAVTNLFYWNNLVHDVMVRYGFDEAHGNFQETNYTGDGVGSDYVNANAQDAYNSACNNANFLTLPDGQSPRMQMYLGCSHTPKMDGDFDNHVIIHEYGHGVSIRMTGGPNNVGCLGNSEQMGEGWSDWYGLMLTQDETADDYGRNESIGVGVFLFHDGNPDGIRPTPYNTDFSVNPTTYGDIGGLVVPHGVGYAWATFLWEVTWDLIDEYGFEQDITNVEALAGNIIAMNLVTEGLNLQPCSPGFVDGRDAILAAVDVVYSDQPVTWRDNLKQIIWEAFARRGLGYLADQGSSSTVGDETEDFTVPSNIPPDAITDLVADPDGDFVTLTWTAPDDDDSDVFGYEVRYASSEILTEEDWSNATSVSQSIVPQAPGTPEDFVVTGLDFETEYHFAVRAYDVPNSSGLSNSVEATTLAPPVATVPTDPIEVTVPAEGADTYEYTIANAGPSTLSYVLRFEETTPAVLNSREAIPRPDSVEDDEQPARDSGEPDDPAPGEVGGEAQLMDEGGPDEFGYRWIDSNEPGGPVYEWVDISETGTELELGLDDHEVIDLPFDFPYYENTYDWVEIQSKGALSFEAGFIGHENQPIPSEAGRSAIVAGYWDDLDPSSISGGGAVYYDTLEDGRFVVTWEGVPFYLSDTEYVTVQIILEPGGTIVTQYKEIVADNSANSATIGIENLDGTDGLEVLYNASYVEDELAIRFTPIWVFSNLTVGQIAAGGDETLVLSFEAGGLDAGSYTADMTVMTNEQSEGLQEYVIPITLTVEGIGTEDDDLAFEGTHRLSAVAPNPVNGLAQTTLEVAEAQDVTVELFDVRGRKVVTAFEGTLAARTAQEITLDAGAVAPGVYVLRVSGETFSDTRRVTVVK